MWSCGRDLCIFNKITASTLALLNRRKSWGVGTDFFARSKRRAEQWTASRIATSFVVDICLFLGVGYRRSRNFVGIVVIGDPGKIV